MQLRRSLCLTGVLFAWVAGAQPDPASTNAPDAGRIKPVTLRECLDLALRRNLDVRIARLDPAIAQYRLKAAVGSQYDPVFSFGYKYDYLNSPATPDPKKSNPDNPYEMTSYTYESGLSGRLTPGLSYNFGGANSKYDINSWLLDPLVDSRGRVNYYPPPYYLVGGNLYGIEQYRTMAYYGASAAVNLKQSLLKDFPLDQGHMEIQVNRKNVKISDQGLLLEIMRTVLAVQHAYFELVYANENLKVMKRSLELAQELLDVDRKRVAGGTMMPLDESLAESKVESARASVLAAEELLAVKQNALWRLLTDEFGSHPEEPLVPTEVLMAVREPTDRSASYQKALLQRPDVVQARLEVERQGIIVRYASNQRLPSLDVSATLGAAGIDDRSRGGATADIGDGHHPYYGLGVMLTVPIANIEARNKYSAAKASKEQMVLRLKKVEQDVLVQLDDVIKVLDKTYHRIKATKQARVYAEAALAAEQRKLASGSSTSFLVSEYERNLVAARTAEILSVVDYNKALAQLAFNEGSTLDRNQIKVDFK